MDTGRPTKTLADYMVMAFSPVLIIAMVQSVCFFLVEVFYRGAAAGGVRWVLFWFVLAVVLIARIGIEQGDWQAMLYGVVLAFVTWLYIAMSQPNLIFGAALLGILWFTAHMITCNCTLIDDDDDASGQGLLQTVRRLPLLFKKSPPQPALTKAAPHALPSSTSSPAKKKRRAQTPGVWLIYYSLAALPIFGLGQTLLPSGDTGARRMSLIYLFCYLAAALGLLVTTSFLGLRRYLRQRYVSMPGNIAFGWVQFGVAVAVAVLLSSLLLPRPGAREAWAGLRYQVDYQIRRASQFAARFNPHGAGSGRAGNESPPNGQQENKPGESSNPNQNANSGANGQGSHSAGKASDQGQSSGNGGGEHPGEPLPSLSPTASALYKWFKGFFWIAATLGLAWLSYRYRVFISTMLRSTWAGIRNFFVALLRLFQPLATAPATASNDFQAPRFKSFKNPFLTGANQIWPPEKLIAHSYAALQSWALEQEAARGSPKTPREFCRQLAEEMPEAAESLEHLAFLYGHVAYGASIPANYNPEHLRLLWDYMAIPRPGKAAVSLPEENLAGKL